MSYRVDISQVVRGLNDAKRKTMFALEVYGRSASVKLERSAKDNAPWHDRTGNARQTITAVAEWQGNSFRIGVAGNTNYFPFLELSREQRFAILWPTIRKLSPEILRGMQGLL